MDENERERIWDGDHLNRKHEADILQSYIERESADFAKMARAQSIVLGIDSPYGRGKTWFLKRFAQQLKAEHPVAFVDAWADDVGDEPLASLMIAIEEALDPFLSKKSKVISKLKAARAAAMPIIGKFAIGAATKAMTKIAGDEINEQIGDKLEEAVRNQSIPDKDDEDGAAAQGAETGIEILQKEVEELVDRRGASILASYRQRRSSRETFKSNMISLLKSISDQNENHLSLPFVIFIDELDRCRPIYAIKLLEEIKHLFDIQGIVFIISIYGEQLSSSIKAVYGADFDSDHYLRRFFTRTYNLSNHSVEELVISLMNEWEIDDNNFFFPSQISGSDINHNAKEIAGKVLNDIGASPREVISVIDFLRLFILSLGINRKIDLIVILVFCLQAVRGYPISIDEKISRNVISFQGISWTDRQSGRPDAYSISGYLRALSRVNERKVEEFMPENALTPDPALNVVLARLKEEYREKVNLKQLSLLPLTDVSYYPRAISSISGFL